jgi:hypothetical protein
MLMLVIFVALVAMICINVPIAVALAVAGVIGLIVTEGVGSLVTGSSRSSPSPCSCWRAPS